MSLYDAILINGVQIPEGLPPEVRAGCCVEGPWEWPYIGAAQRGEFPVFLGFDGAGYVSQPYQVNVLPFYVTLSAPPCSGGVSTQNAETFAWMNHAVEVIRGVCQPDQPSTLTRRRSMMPYSPDESQDALAKLSNITPSRPTGMTLKLVVEFSLLDGCWFGSSIAEVISGSSTLLTAKGDTRTHRMVIQVAGTNPTVTNLTNGYSFTLNTTTAGAYVDVDARTAGSSPGGTDLTRYLTWTKPQVMRLEPGVNNMAETGTGSVTITYYPAYL